MRRGINKGLNEAVEDKSVNLKSYFSAILVTVGNIYTCFRSSGCGQFALSFLFGVFLV